MEDKKKRNPAKNFGVYALKGAIPWNKGLTKEISEGLKRTSLKLTGRKLSKKTIEKVRNKMLGRRVKEETKKNILKGIKRRQLKGLHFGRFKGSVPWNKGKKDVYTKEMLIVMKKNQKKGWTKQKRDKVSERMKETWKDPKFKKDRIKKFSKSLKNNYKDIKYKERLLKAQMKGRKLRPNKPETIVINLIQQNNLNFIYVGDGKFWIKRDNNLFNPDFISKDKKYIIEVFGDYWHNRKDIKERDKRRLKTYKKEGYNTLIVWENELKEPIKVLNKIILWCIKGW